MRNLFQRFLCEWLILIAILAFFSTRNISSPYDKSIIAEGFGYYAYLPGAFIYHELDSFEWFNEVYPKYYSPGFDPPSRNFLAAYKNDWVNKYFPGLAWLSLPFFLIAHLLALSGLGEPDGFSLTYQYAFAASAFFYAWLGLRFLNKLLKLFNLTENIRAITILAVFLGTPLFFYTVYASFQPHAYLFFLVVALSYYLKLFFDGDGRVSTLLYISLCTGFIAIIRPFDLVYALCLPFFGFQFSKIQLYIKRIANPKSILALCIPISVLSLSLFALWHNQTGTYFLDPYGGERFYFSKPHVFDFLFSFRRGWFIYTPLAALSFLGILHFKKNGNKLLIFLFFAGLIYVLSCWWSWTFGTNFGMRPLVDFTVLTALMLAHLYAKIRDTAYYKLMYGFTLLCIALNIWQSYQFQKGIIDPDYTSTETYFRYFFTAKKPASFPVPPKTILQKQVFQFDFEKALDENQRSKKFAKDGNQSAIVHSKNPYTLGEKFGFPPFFQMNGYEKIRVKAWVMGNCTNGKTVLAIDFRKAFTGENIHWHSLPIEKFKENSRWTYVETGCSLPENCSKQDSVSIYFWNTEGQDTTWIDGVEIEFLQTDSLYELRL